MVDSASGVGTHSGSSGPSKLERQNKLLKDALKRTVKKYDKIDNGRCAVCKIGHRMISAAGNVGKCENVDCLSHVWRKALRAK